MPVSQDTVVDRRRGSIGILSTCSACHVKKNACSECHNGINMPHDDAWISQHGKRVNATSQEGLRPVPRHQGVLRDLSPGEDAASAGASGRRPKVAERVGTGTCFNCHLVANCQACHEERNAGDPRAHRLFKGVKYKLPPASPSATAVGTGE